MDLQELKRLVSLGESGTLEFKRKVAYPEKVIREIVAFANSAGGVLLVGVNDHGHISGLKDPHGEAHVLELAIRRFIRPFLKYRKEEISITSDKKVLAFHIPASRKKPHFIRKRNNHECFIRINDRSVKATREIIEILRKSNNQRGTYINYGTSEQILLRYLEEHGFITLDDFIKIADISRKDASRSLVKLVLAEVILVEPGEGRDIYLNNPNIE